jgi:hypothetical protein
MPDLSDFPPVEDFLARLLLGLVHGGGARRKLGAYRLTSRLVEPEE